jgi:tetratricopeptide (TPR) repeat protein
VGRHEGAARPSPPTRGSLPAALPAVAAAPTAPLADESDGAPDPLSALAQGPGAGARTAAPAPTADLPAAAQALASECLEIFDRRAWSEAVPVCRRAAEAQPASATLAMKAAHAYYARGNFPSALEWATRAVTVDPTDAEAYVIIGNGERFAGRAPEAVAAYRTYLSLAPRGWHARKVRAALAQLADRAP